MYIKVTAGADGNVGDFLLPINLSERGGLRFGYVTMPWSDDPESEFDYAAMMAAVGGTDVNETMHVLEFTPDRTDYERDKGVASFKFARWHDRDSGMVTVATTRNIFILNDDGKTIDRS